MLKECTVISCYENILYICRQNACLPYLTEVIFVCVCVCVCVCVLMMV